MTETSTRPRRAFGIVPATALLALSTFAVAWVAGAWLATAEAAPRRDRAAGYVTAESRWGHGTASGPVRRGKWGWQVRLPGGTWVDCVRNNCSETLRLQALDMFESMGRDAIDGGPGYFRWERRF